jgi:hypothetical protein
VNPRKGKPLQGAKGEKAQASAIRKLLRGKSSKSKSELPGITVRRGRQEGA